MYLSQKMGRGDFKLWEREICQKRILKQDI